VFAVACALACSGAFGGGDRSWQPSARPSVSARGPGTTASASVGAFGGGDALLAAVGAAFVFALVVSFFGAGLGFFRHGGAGSSPSSSFFSSLQGGASVLGESSFF